MVCRLFDVGILVGFTVLVESARTTGGRGLILGTGESGLDEASVSVSRVSGSVPNRRCHHSTT